MQTSPKKSGFLTLFYVALTCVLTGGLLGAVTNMINGAVSPYYFKKLMHWDFENIWIAAVIEGMKEGLFFGVIFSVIFTTGFGIITKGLAGYGFAFSQLLKTTSFVCICWMVGGIFALLLTSINPDFYGKLFPITPKERIAMLKFAWVGGSIWGGMIGGLLSAILGVFSLRNRWQQMINPEE